MTPKVIVIDDDATSASVLAKLLRRLGCDVTACTDARHALPLALGVAVDLVSLDLTMPELDGHQALSLIRSHEHSTRSASVPVIAVTGRVTPDDRADALANGFAAHLGKPVMLHDLRAALARALTLRSDLHRTRYTDDRERIEAAMRGFRDRAGTGGLHAAAGLALAIEQQGRATLQRALRLAFAGHADAARAPIVEYAHVAELLGAKRLGVGLNQVLDHLQDDEPSALETAAVLARAELDRVVYTLREQVRPG